VITVLTLAKLGACPSALGWFSRRFPEGGIPDWGHRRTGGRGGRTPGPDRVARIPRAGRHAGVEGEPVRPPQRDPWG